MKIHLLLLVTVCLMVFLIFVGSFYRRDLNLGIIGFNGFINGNFNSNFDANFQDDYDFFKVLAIFFPAISGADPCCACAIQ